MALTIPTWFWATYDIVGIQRSLIFNVYLLGFHHNQLIWLEYEKAHWLHCEQQKKIQASWHMPENIFLLISFTKMTLLWKCVQMFLWLFLTMLNLKKYFPLSLNSMGYGFTSKHNFSFTHSMDHCALIVKYWFHNFHCDFYFYLWTT